MVRNVIVKCALTCRGWLIAASSASFVCALMTTSVCAQIIEADCDAPYYANWNSGIVVGGYDPQYQMNLIERGARIAPWFTLPMPSESFGVEYYAKAIQMYADRKLPLTFVSTQWERVLGGDEYLSIADDSNPNVVLQNGDIMPVLSPFGDERHWYEVGYKWTSRRTMQQLQKMYPDPPRVVFLSNNEHPRLKWDQLDLDRRWLSRFGRQVDSNDPEALRRLAIAQWRKLYISLQQGMRDGLVNDIWKSKAIFVGYMANGNGSMGRSKGWEAETLYTSEAMDPYATFWDGSSYSIYYNNEDSYLKSTPISVMNSVFMVEHNRNTYRDYYVEISVWDGHTYNHADWRTRMEARRQGWSLAAYRAVATFGAWLLRPEVIREFRFYNEKVDSNQAYTEAVLDLTAEIDLNPVLKKFWCEGILVPNRSTQNPYDINLPDIARNADRWFLLDTERGSDNKWSHGPDQDVYAIALLVGHRPERQWLIYAYATKLSSKTVRVLLPDFGWVVITAEDEGTYFLVNESTGTVENAQEKAHQRRR